MSSLPLFEDNSAKIEPRNLVLYALGDFQSRGKILAERELALDRLRGAFKRAADRFQMAELSDEKIAETLKNLGAKVVQLPTFVAKHPFRVTVQKDLAEQSAQFFQSSKNDN